MHFCLDALLPCCLTAPRRLKQNTRHHYDYYYFHYSPLEPPFSFFFCTISKPIFYWFHMASQNRGIAVFSGGSAANNLVDVFDALREGKDCPLSYIIPISDNGGSSSELIRIFGGPGIGDVRSKSSFPSHRNSAPPTAS